MTATDLTDPTDHTAPGAAQAAATRALLRCWVRETGVPRPQNGVLRLHLAASGTTLEAPVDYWSKTGWHGFGCVRFAGGGPLDPVTLAALLCAEAVGRNGCNDDRVCSGAVIDLAGRVADSVRRMTRHVDARSAAAGGSSGTTPFLAAEQALLLGHPLHPAPLSREGISDAEAGVYSPELRGSFPLHWFAAAPAVVAGDSALHRSAEQITASLVGTGLRLPPGTVALPAHPWQARDVVTRPRVRELLERGLLHDLGPAGPEWSPTSSVRTVYRADAPVMLKLSLGLRITNSKRENLRLELARGLEVHRLLAAGLADALHSAYPHFDIVRDPAWIALDVGGHPPESGLEVGLRDNPFRGTERVACLAGLVAECPEPAQGGSQLVSLVQSLAARSGRTIPAVAEEWFVRYLHAVVVPVLWLYASHGLGLEAHQQNTLVTLDDEGWPDGGRYRDNQGYYFSATRSGGLCRWLPDLRRDLGTLCSDEVIDERLGYYIGINNMLGLIGAMGSSGLADEATLLRRARVILMDLQARHGDALSLAGLLLESPTLRCKANLLTRVEGLDELTGPLEAQSVYVDVANPFAEVTA